MFELASIYIQDYKTVFRPGDFIAFDFAGIRLEEDFATHKIIGCFGSMDAAQFEIMLIDVITNEPTIIKL